MANDDIQAGDFIYGGLFHKGSGTSVFFDCTLHQVIHRGSEVTSNPIEDGSSIADHIIKLPMKVDLEVILASTKFFGQKPATARLEILNSFMESGAVLSLAVSTLDKDRFSTGDSDQFISGGTGAALTVHDNMAITSLTVTDTPEVGLVSGVIRLSMKLEQITVVSSAQETKVTGNKHKKKRNRGNIKEGNLSLARFEVENKVTEIFKDAEDRFNRQKIANRNKIVLEKLKPGETIGGGDPSGFLP